MTDRTPLDDLKSVLGGAARALSREEEIELAYTADVPSGSDKNIKVPMPGRNLPQAIRWPRRAAMPTSMR